MLPRCLASGATFCACSYRVSGRLAAGEDKAYVGTRPKSSHANWLAKWFGRRAGVPPELQRATQLLAAIDAGGIPLNPAIVNRIARGLGLEVSMAAPMDETVGRIREAVARGCGTGA